MNKSKIKQMIFDYMYGHDINSVDEKDQIQFEDYFEELKFILITLPTTNSREYKNE